MKKLLSILMIVAFISSCQKQTIEPISDSIVINNAVSPLTQSTIDTLSLKWRLVETTDWINGVRVFNYMYNYYSTPSQGLTTQFYDKIQFNSAESSFLVEQFQYDAPYAWTYTVGLAPYSTVSQTGPDITQSCTIHGDTIALPAFNCWNKNRSGAVISNFSIPKTLVWTNSDPTGIGTKSILMTDSIYPAGFVRVMSFIRA